MTEQIDRLKAAVEDIQGEMCCLEHPLWRVICMKKIGHKGAHWFMTRWDGAAEAIEDAALAIRRIVEEGSNES